MKLQLSYSWIQDSDFSDKNPIDAEIVDLVKGGKNDSENILQFRTSKGLRQMSIYRENLNLLINTWGEESESWKGHRIRIMQFTNAADGKKRRTFEV